jgi:hypothetical protein
LGSPGGGEGTPRAVTVARVSPQSSANWTNSAESSRSYGPFVARDDPAAVS